MKRRTYWQWVRIGSGSHLGILLLLYGGLIGFILFQSFLRQSRFKPVQGTILKSAAKPCENGTFSPEITFAYTVDRRRYTGGRYREDFGRVGLEKSEVEAILGRYPPGETVQAWYDPKRPSLAVIDRSLGTMHYGFLFVVGFAVVLAFAWLFRRRFSV